MARLQSVLLTLLLAAALPSQLAAQGHNIRNADLQAIALTGGLDQTVRGLVAKQPSPAWIAYVVPRVAGSGNSCCYREGFTGCSLEDRGGVVSSVTDPIPLEGSATLQVLLRVEDGKLTLLRGFSGECPLDAGGRTVYWLGALPSADSVRFLSAFVEEPDTVNIPVASDHVSKHSVAIIAFHAGAEAEQALARYVAPGRPEKVRKSAASWLASARGARGFEILRDVVREDDDERFRRDAMFAIHVSKEPAALDELIRFARNDSSGRVRGQALFWLAQKAGDKAAATVRDAVDRDPDTEVKKQAVFALHQLPKDEAIPLLIRVASTNNNREVRKQALFWLGQSNDPRALDFIEKLLTQ